MTRPLLRRSSALSRRAPKSVRRSIAGPLPMHWTAEPRVPAEVIVTGIVGAIVAVELVVGLVVIS